MQTALITAYERLLAELAHDLGASAGVLEFAPRGSDNPMTMASYGGEARGVNLTWFEQRIHEGDMAEARLRLGFADGVALPSSDDLRLDQARVELLVLLRLAGWKDVASPMLQACQRILAVNEEELQHVILDIHDGPVQKLFAASSRLELMLNRMGQADAVGAQLQPELARVAALLEASLHEIKNTLGTMRPPEFRRRPLVSVLEGLLIQHETLTGMTVNFEVQGDVPAVSLPAKIAIYRILQEALSNADRHAKVDSLDVVLEGERDWVTLEVVDAGPGFEPPPLEGPTGTERAEHIGLRGMRDRALLVGGQIRLVSKPGEGTSIRVRVPANV